MQKSPELAGVQMAPDTFLSVVPAGQLALALRKGPAHQRSVLGPDFHLLLADVQFNLADEPVLLEFEDSSIE